MKKITISKAAIILIMICSVWFQFSTKKWRWDAVIVWDVVSYYAYLPAAFIYDDISLDFTEKDPEFFSNKFWPSKSPTGKNVIKTSMGMALMYSPFFAAAHLLAKPLGYTPNGFSTPYQFFISIGALFYLLIGLAFLRKLLLKFFKEPAVAITLVLITLGTNLWYYSTMEPGMSHTYSFALFALFLYLLDRWLEVPKVSNTFLLGIICGLIALVRPTNALVGVFFILWNVSSIGGLKDRVFLLSKRWKHLLALSLLAIVVWIPQLIYWKVHAGQLLFSSYGEERFFFLSPRILEGLFGFRKGLFVYTPVMMAAFAGFLLLRRYAKGSLFAIVAFSTVNVYIVFSWWSWWYGGGFGARAMIESFVFLAFPLAALIQFTLSKNKLTKVAVFSILFLLFGLNIKHTFQYYHGAIHWDSMTIESYFKAFGKFRPFPGLENYWKTPDYDKALKGINAYVANPQNGNEQVGQKVKALFCEMENLDASEMFFISDDGKVLLEGGAQQSKEKARSGRFSAVVGPSSPFALAHSIEANPGEFIKIEIWRHSKSPKEAVLVASATNPDVFYKATGLVSATEGEWNLLSLNINIPENYPDNQLKIYVWNPSSKNAHFDDLLVYRIAQ